MSWDGYITQLTAEDPDGTKYVEEAAICGKEQGQQSVWAASPRFRGITPAEIRALSGPHGDTMPMPGSIITLAGVKAMVIRDDEDDRFVTTVTMKSPEMPETQQLVISFTSKVLVIGLGSARKGPTVVRVVKMAKYLRDSGY